MTLRSTESGKGWTMHRGDALSVLRRLELARDRLRVVTDPPYGTKTYKTDVDGGTVVRVFVELCDARTLAFFGYPELLVGWCMRAFAREPDEWVTWFPTNAAPKAGGRSTLLPKWHESIAIYGNVPGAKRLTHKRSEASCKKPQNGHLGPLARLGDVWTDASPGIAFNSDERIHPNEKAVATMLKLVELASERRDVVLDPFAGSATTGIACLRLGRRFVGIEKDHAFFATAVARLRAEESGSTLAAARRGQGALFA